VRGVCSAPFRVKVIVIVDGLADWPLKSHQMFLYFSYRRSEVEVGKENIKSSISFESSSCSGRQTIPLSSFKSLSPFLGFFMGFILAKNEYAEQD
jgi:hypothetical protein